MSPAHTPIVQGWSIDGNPQPGEFNVSFALDPDTLAAGAHTVSIATYNPTPWVHPGFALDQQAVTQEITWELMVE